MNIFEKRTEIDNEIDKKCHEIWGLLKTIAKDKNVELPDFVRGVYFDLSQYDHTDYIDNPHYDPSLPHTLENRALETGFSQIEKVTSVVGFTANENEDKYEDFGCDSYHLQIPSDIFFGTSEITMSEFLESHIQKDVDFNESNDRRKYSCIFDMDKKQIQNIYSYCVSNNINIEDVEDYRERERILKAAGVMKEND